MPTTSSLSERVTAVRRFNRLYTRRLGMLRGQVSGSPFTLPEARLLWELAHRDGLTAATLARELDLDAGYLSRLLRQLRDRGLIVATPSTQDARHRHLALTAAGREAYAPLDARSQAETEHWLSNLTEAQQAETVQAMAQIERLLASAPAPPSFVVLRPHRPGDLGWIVSRHGAVYAEEYGWNQQFEALVARIAADFLERFNPRLEACWIAEHDGQNAGSIVLVQCRDAAGEAMAGVAQLRLLLVEPGARGLGLGGRLVDECVRFARRAGYGRIRLWTESRLAAARQLYRQAGFAITATTTGTAFGDQVTNETWELTL